MTTDRSDMTAPEFVSVTRPNGKVYRPRKGPRAWLVDDASTGDPDRWVYVLGTHDIERAFALASLLTAGADRVTAEQTWCRLVMRDNERCFDYDPVRGAPAVVFEVNE